MILRILQIPLTALEVLAIFNLMIIVHELGHFLAARWRGMKIDKFGIWFGKPIWKKTINGVEYSFGTIPFGGFVVLPQMASMEAIEGKTDTPRESLPVASNLSKIIVAVAGPLFSFMLACAFAVLVFAVGRPVSESEATTTIGFVIPDSPAAKVGIQVGDKILNVDGRPVTHFGGMGEDSIEWRIVRSEGTTIPILVQRMVNGVATTKEFDPEPEIEPTKPWMRKALREIGVQPAMRTLVADVDKGGAAEKAGIQVNDLITTIDGQQAYSLESMADYVKDHPAASYSLGILRDGSPLTLTYTPTGAVVDTVSTDSPAEAAGLKPGDSVIAADHKPTPDNAAVTEYVLAHGAGPITFTVRNAAGTRDLAITPQIPVGETSPRIGLRWKDEFGIAADATGEYQILHPGPIEQVRSGMLSVIDTIGAIASSKSDVKLQHMGGPVFMMRVYYMLFQSREGWRLALWFSVVINVNLALINMLPFPILDGGHITLAIIESIRRKPVNTRFIEIAHNSCAVLVLGFMLYIAFFDVQDFFGPKPDQMRFEKAPPAQQSK